MTAAPVPRKNILMIIPDQWRYDQLGMDPALTKRLDEAFKKSLEDPQVIASFEKYDQPVIYMGSDEYARFAQRTFASEKRLIEKLGLAKAI